MGAATRTAAEAAKYTAELTASPAIGMLLGSVLLLVVKAPPERFVFMMQHFGAGIVLSAVATELLPEVAATPNETGYILAILIGFSLGVGMMVAMANFCGEAHLEEEEDETHGKEEAKGGDASAATAEIELASRGTGDGRLNPASPTSRGPQSPSGASGAGHALSSCERSKSFMRGLQKRKSMRNIYSEMRQTASWPMARWIGDRAVPEDGEEGDEEKEGATCPDKTTADWVSLPQGVRCLGRDMCKSSFLQPTGVRWPLVVAVYVDACMDGFLIGISSVAGATAGVVMAVALTIEMTFLGLTFSACLVKAPLRWRAPLVVISPCLIMIAGAVGSAAASALIENPVMQTGLISFGSAALLYLVTEELLLEAHECNGHHVEHVWYIDLAFFVGFMGSLLVEKLAEGRQ